MWVVRKGSRRWMVRKRRRSREGDRRVDGEGRTGIWADGWVWNVLKIRQD
jgi:hypothetical protein